jgi:3-dehydroquinate synthase
MAMQKKSYQFSNATVDYYFDSKVEQLKKLVDPKYAVLITDEHVHAAHEKRFAGWNTIVLRGGEEYKVQATVNVLIESLIEMEADRKTTLIGIGGGVITDIVGYLASVYMRGIPFGFVPTSILGIVDASIGGKNGVDVGIYKNMVGVIRQPQFILHDLSLLSSLPEKEWVNGFAEIIKHACIKDAKMFKELKNETLQSYQQDKKKLAALIRRNALIKTKVVQQDEFEKAERRLLNFGHTLGHAIENQYGLMHGHAVSIGMMAAAKISKQLTGFKQTEKLVKVLEQYGLPVAYDFDKEKTIGILKMDKKRERKELNYILLDKIGKGIVKPVPLPQLEKLILAL